MKAGIIDRLRASALALMPPLARVPVPSQDKGRGEQTITILTFLIRLTIKIVYEAANEADKAAWADAKNSECITAMNAIHEVLGILGYSVRWTGEDGNTPLILE